MWIIVALYLIAAVWLTIYGGNSLWLTFRYWRTRRMRPTPPPLTNYPYVTVQLPIFNELHVVERLIDAVAALDYPRDRLQIQVLDDSTDETSLLLRALVSQYRRQGLDIELIHRDRRIGYKAGALSHGLARAKGEFIAVFDADFVPPRDWLRRTVPHLVAHPDAGFVQTRWGHINATYSPLTMAQAILLDAHFAIEHTARQRSGYFINFNGTAGLWRRACIEDAGGWRGDTLTEDLDLSYRAQLAGWRALYLPDVVAPAEIPPQLAAFKRQQFRWAKGSAQCLRRLASAVWHSEVPLQTRLQGLIHLSGYLSHPLMLVVLLLSLPLIWWGWPVRLPLAPLSLASLGPPLIFAVSQFVLYRGAPQGMAWWRRALYVPLVLLLGAGIAPNNTRAVIEGLLDREGEFRRTPKFRVERREDHWADKPYALSLSSDILVESSLAIYALVVMIAAWMRGLVWALPFLGLYAGGFLLVSVISVWQNRQRSCLRLGGRTSAWSPSPGATPPH
ncbi:MAG TPA: glycosyltransferase [Caldilineae bacterium]|nr:glycosyltransferase [Caldilineae bacterium]